MLRMISLKCLPVICMSLLSFSVFADSQLTILKYSYVSLDRFWNNLVVESNQPSSTTFSDLLLSSSMEDGDAGGRLGGVWGDDGEMEASFIFDVKKIPSNVISSLTRREVALHMYLNRELYYEAPTSDNRIALLKLRPQISLEKSRLDSRRTAAAAELFLMKMLSYLHEDTLLSKCKAIEEANYYQLIANALGINDISDEEEPWKNLNAVFDSVVSRYQDDLDNKMVCQVREVFSENQVRQQIEQQVNEYIIAALEQENTDSIAPINSVQGEFSTLLDEAKAILPKTEELLVLEGNMEAAAANIEFVYNDLFEVATGSDPLIFQVNRRLNEEQLAKIKRIESTPESLANVISKQEALQDNIRVLFSTLQKFPLTSCLNLDSQYEGLMNSLPEFNPSTPVSFPGINSASLMNNLDICLADTQSYLNGIGLIQPEEQMPGLFAQHLRMLSNQMIIVNTNQ